MLELILGQIPEAIFFALFMIYAKGLKEKRTLFTGLMIAEYLLLKHSFKFNWFFQIGYMITTYLTLKVLYREKSQITDVFILLIAYMFMIITSVICVLLFKGNPVIISIANRIIIFLCLFLFKNEISKIQKIYKNNWNRNDKKKVKIKSTTFRALNIVIFNIIYFIINLGMLYAIYFNSKGGD